MTDTNGPADGEGRVPLAQVLPGLRIHPLEQGSQPLEAFVLIKLLDPEGGPTWAYRTTSKPNREELLGSLRVQVALRERELVDEWNDPADE